MNRINPIHIAILLIVVLGFFVVNLGSAKEELSQTKALYQETLQLSTQLKGLSDVYSDKNGVKKSLNKILKHKSLSSCDIKKKTTNSGMIISSANMNKTALNFLVGKLLNGSYNIYSFKIKRLSDDKASFKMEIKW